MLAATDDDDDALAIYEKGVVRSFWFIGFFVPPSHLREIWSYRQTILCTRGHSAAADACKKVFEFLNRARRCTAKFEKKNMRIRGLQSWPRGGTRLS